MDIFTKMINIGYTLMISVSISAQHPHLKKDYIQIEGNKSKKITNSTLPSVCRTGAYRASQSGLSL